MADLLTARAQTARECAAFYVGELGHASVRDEEAAVRDLTARTLELGGPFDALCAAYDAALARVTAERDEARRALRYRDALDGTHTGASACFNAAVLNAIFVRRDALTAYGAILRATRNVRSKTLHECSALLGCSVPALSDVERSKAPPFSDDATRRLCAFLGCDPQPLLDAAAKCEEAMR